MMARIRFHGGGVLVPLLALATVFTVPLVTGCPGVPGIGGGTLSGTITNSLTDQGLAGAEVALDPPVEGVDITTSTDGTYSAQLPTGLYTLTFDRDHFESETRDVVVVSGTATRADAALEPTSPVVVTTVVQGTPDPGTDVAVSANVETLDGSTVQSISWTTGNPNVTIGSGNTATPTVSLPELDVFKTELFNVLEEPPITAEQLPPNVPLPEGEFPGGLPDRFHVVGLNPFVLEEAGLAELTVTVTTTSGTYTAPAEIHVELPWEPTAGIRNVPIGVPVLLHGRMQASYDWAITGPNAVSLIDPDSQHPYFTPTETGLYTVTITDQTTDPDEVLTLEIYAGTWEGAITGQGPDGRPEAEGCMACHDGGIARDYFTPWRQSGHAEIFADSLNFNDHYSTNCLPCHTVGYNPGVANGGIDDVDDWQPFLAALTTDGVHFIQDPDNWQTTLNQFPEVAKHGNVQCENCHGPNESPAHTLTDPRVSLSSDVCATCHGEPLRHGRFQQWQLSGHANLELAVEEGQRGSCARCHTANGFLAWLPVLLDEDPATDPFADVEIAWTEDETFAITCTACHDPHDIGTVSGAETDATVRIAGDTPPLIAGFTMYGAGKGAICATCHNSRRGLRNDQVFDEIAAEGGLAVAPHPSVQTDVLMGQNAFFVQTGIRGPHSLIEDTCVNCHMVQTPPPDLLSYNQGGSNHTFFASLDTCDRCHTEMLAPLAIQASFEERSEQLLMAVEGAILDVLAEQIAAGNSIDLDGTALTDTGTIADLAFTEFRGQQAIAVTLTNGEVIGPVGLNSVQIVDNGTALGEFYELADPRLAKAAWNYGLVHNDGSESFHNPEFVFEILAASLQALDALADEN